MERMVKMSQAANPRIGKASQNKSVAGWIRRERRVLDS
jgi:hypothetical protein